MSDNISKTKIAGVDCGTMFFQVATPGENNAISLKTTRNAFVELADSDDIEEVLKQNKWQYVRDGNRYYVIGEDSLRVARMFPGKVELRRPLSGGVLNKGEDKKMLVLSELIESSIGKATDDESVVCTCISSEAADGSVNSTFHKARLEGMFKRLGWNVKIIEEGLAVVLSERPVIVESDGTESPFSGIGVSFGSGRVNCVLAYKGLQVIGMSVSRCVSKDFPVLTCSGTKPIKDICVGEEVIGANGEEVVVLDVIDNGYRDTLLSIRLKNLPYLNLDVTQDHKMFIKDGFKWKWVEAKDIKKGDVCGEPVINFSTNKHSYYLGYDSKKKQGVYRMKSRNLGRMIGLFLGDGSTNIYKREVNSCGYIQWAMNSNDTDKINKYVDIIEGVFKQSTQIDCFDKNLVRIKIHNSNIAKYFKKVFYKDGEKTINIPFNDITDQMAIGIIEGLIDSDGNKNNRNGVDITNTSKSIIELVHILLNRFGIKHSITEREPRLGGINSKGIQIVGRKNTYVIRISGIAYSIFNAYSSCENTRIPFTSKDFTEYIVEDVLQKKYCDNVYDLSVASNHHSFASLGAVVHNCGDWVDQQVSEQTDTPISQVTSKKEKELDFTDLNYDDDVIFALDAYYTAMIEYVFGKFAVKFGEVKSEFDAPLDIVVAGGTAMPKGFCEKLENIVRGLDLPFFIKDVKMSADPRNSVVKGCLTQAIIAQKKLKKSQELNKMLGET